LQYQLRRNIEVAANNSEIVELIAKARAGDGEALGTLLDRHRDYLRGLAALKFNVKLQGRVDDSDIIQQTCLSVHKQIGQFVGKDPAEFVAWLRLIHERNIQNAARDQLLAKKRAAGRDVSLEPAEIAGDEITPSQIVVRDEERERLRLAMKSLPEAEREIVNLRYFRSWSISQIAGSLGLTEDAVAWRLKCGMKMMKKNLKEDAP
jgi:RNA polymerase sigma-70 factor (ECF subfamily)